MKQSRIFSNYFLLKSSKTLENVLSKKSKIFCKYFNNNLLNHNNNQLPEIIIKKKTIQKCMHIVRRKRKRRTTTICEQSNFTNSQFIPMIAFKNVDYSYGKTFICTGRTSLFIIFIFALLFTSPVFAQINKTGRNLTIPNGTISSQSLKSDLDNNISTDYIKRSNSRFSVFNFQANTNNTAQHFRPLHFRSYHFAKVLLFPVRSSSGLNGTTSSSTAIFGSYNLKHNSIKRKRSGRYRRLTPATVNNGGNIASNIALHSFHPKTKPIGSGQIPGLGPMSASSIPGQGRIKIHSAADLGSQSPFGPVVPDSKCNYELYPSGCFDENGSVCDSSALRCVCRPGHSIQLEGLYCLRPATIGEACYTTEQCERRVAHSGCFNYREEYRLEHPSDFFGPAQSSWPMGECRCRAGYRHEPSLGACTPALIGAWCSNAWDCQDPNWTDSSSHPHHSNKPLHGNAYHHGGFHNRSSSGSHHGLSGSSSLNSGSHRKISNVVCDGNVCACASFFHFNESASECQYRETYGQTCKISQSSVSSSSSSSSSSSLFVSDSSSQKNDLIKCNPPSMCSKNGTCVCPDNFEYQFNAKPQCQRIKGQSSANLFGSSNRAGKGDGFFDFDRGSSSLTNFAEYVLYVLIPALIIIFAMRPCFRRIGEWRNHVHQYASDADFFQGFTRPVMSVAEMNALQTAAEKGVSSTTSAAATFTFDSCHAPYLFDSAALVDSCFGFTPTPHTSVYGHHRSSLGPNDPSLALVREKLQTIEESQSESGIENGLITGTGSICRCGTVAGMTNCCEAQLCAGNTNDDEPGPGNLISQSSPDFTATISSNPVEDENNHETSNTLKQTPQESIVDSV